jgi:AsmA protein
MKRLKRLLLMMTGLVCVSVALILILAKILITPERVRESLVPLVTETLHRELQVGKIEISLFSGIILSDVVLLESDSTESFLSVDKAVLRYRFFPLLFFKIELDELRLEQPLIKVQRFADGRFNFSDIVESSAEQTPDQSAETNKSTNSAVSVYISEIVVENGSFSFLDQFDGEKRSHSIAALNLSIHDFSTSEAFDIDLSADWNNSALSLNGQLDLDDRAFDMAAKFKKVKLTLKGDLLADVKGDRLRAEVELPSTSVSALLGALPSELIDLPADLNPSGQFSAQFQLDGPVSEPENILQTGQLDFIHASAQIGHFQAGLNGRILLDHKAMSIQQLTLLLNGQDFHVSGVVSRYLQQPLQMNLLLRSAKVNLDRFLPAQDNMPEKGQPSDSQPPFKDSTPLDLPVDLTGTIQIDELLYNGLLIKNIDVGLLLNRNLLTIERFTANLADGFVELAGKVNLGVPGFNYQAEAKLENIKMNPVLQAFDSELAENIQGPLSGQFALQGTGTRPDVIQKNLTGDGKFTINRVEIGHLPILDSASQLLNLPELNELVIDEGYVIFKINQGVVDIDLGTFGTRLKQTSIGTLDFSGPIRFKVKASLSPTLSKKLDRRQVLGNVLTDKEGWTHIPLRVKGEYSSPKVLFDTRAIGEQVKQKAVEKLSERLLKEIDRSKTPADSTNNDDPAAKLIDKAIKGLFGN